MNEQIVPASTAVNSPNTPVVSSDGTGANRTTPKSVWAERVWSRKEKLLIPVAFVIAVLYDMLVRAPLGNYLFGSTPMMKKCCCMMAYEYVEQGGYWRNNFSLFALSAAFWLVFIIVFYAFNWERIKQDIFLWFVSACTIALCVWNFIYADRAYFNENFYFAMITYFVIPGVLMAQVQWFFGGFRLHNAEGIAFAWLRGWFEKPFTALPGLFAVSSVLVSKENKPVVKRIAIGSCFAVMLLLVVVPLLMGADQVFNYMVSNILFSGEGDIGSFIFRSVFIIITFGLLYSFLWNAGFAKEDKIYRIPGTWSIDIVISAIVLGSVMLVYILFCVIQFTYLFAGAGLPYGMTFSEYAREGFGQTVTVCAINLLLYAIFLRLGARSNSGGRILKWFLSGLLVLTGVMLVSGAVRLNLYIDVFGMTWLRLLSAWFLIYLSVVTGLCALRLFKTSVPIAPLCGLFLLVWYVVLGLLNPDGFIWWFNIQRIM